jgi:hypothetical protein
MGEIVYFVPSVLGFLHFDWDRRDTPYWRRERSLLHRTTCLAFSALVTFNASKRIESRQLAWRYHAMESENWDDANRKSMSEKDCIYVANERMDWMWQNNSSPFSWK